MTEVHQALRMRRLAYGDFFRTFFGRTTVRIYILISLIATVATLGYFGLSLDLIKGLALVVVVYPFIEYALHRYLFHSQYLFRHPLTAGLWKRLHYDHHLHPDDGDLIFGPIEMMIPTSVAVSLPLGYLAGGAPGAAAALCFGLWILAIYELFHGAAHLPVEPKSGYGKLLKRVHMLHHFHNEQGNYGITTPIADWVFGTYYAGPKDAERSPTVKNIGYTDEMAAKYPWVREIEEAEAAAKAKRSAEVEEQLAALKQRPAE